MDMIRHHAEEIEPYIVQVLTLCRIEQVSYSVLIALKQSTTLDTSSGHMIDGTLASETQRPSHLGNGDPKRTTSNH
jgi:hypothetical protein